MLPLKDTGEGCCGGCAHLKEELQLLKHTVDSVVADIGRLKQPIEAMPAMRTEAMPAMRTEQPVVEKNMQIVIDSSILGPVFLAFVCVFIGVVVAGM